MPAGKCKLLTMIQQTSFTGSCIRLSREPCWAWSLQVGPARQARAYVEPSGPKEQGFVARFQDTFGFIR